MKSYILTEKNQDRLAINIIFVASFVFYYLGCIKLLEAGFYEKINLAFDLDQSWYFDFVGRDTTDWLYKGAVEHRPLAIKHPFIYLYHYITQFITVFGLTENKAVIILSQLFHSGSLIVSYYVFRSLRRHAIDAALLTIGLAGTSTYISTGLVLDVYTLSIFWIAAIFLIVCMAEYHQKECPVWARAIVSIMAIGTTAYLIILVCLMELALVNKSKEIFFYRLIEASLYKQFLRIFLLGLALFIIIYAPIIIDLIHDPLAVIKHAYWTVNRPGEKEGILQVLSVFGVFSIVSPVISQVTLPEGINMIDLRLFDFSAVGWVGVVLLGLFLINNISKSEHRFILYFGLIWLAINLCFHLIYQYRGSLFLYTGHFVFAVWLIILPNVEIFKKIIIQRSVLLICISLILINNYKLYNTILTAGF